MGSGRALQKSLSIHNGRGYKAKLGLGFFTQFPPFELIYEKKN